MALSQYKCPACGLEDLRHGSFVPVPDTERLYKGQEVRVPEICPCGAAMVFAPTCSAHDLFQNFEIDYGDGLKKISSLTELRRIEAESMKKFANGEGAPLIWRDLSQDHSNRDRNVFTGTPYERARSEKADHQTTQGRPITGRAIPEAVAHRR